MLWESPPEARVKAHKEELGFTYEHQYARDHHRTRRHSKARNPIKDINLATECIN